mgnify:CR=1 FL=1
MSEDVINKNVEEATEDAGEKQVVIPEFYRDLNRDSEHRSLWHYVFRTNGDRKPIKTTDGLPHKLDFNWKDMFENEPYNLFPIQTVDCIITNTEKIHDYLPPRDSTEIFIV